MAKERAARLEVKMEPLYQSARNLKEYVRLVGRLCRILYEMNQLQELRISTANPVTAAEHIAAFIEQLYDVR